jgi:hypothetical protein
MRETDNESSTYSDLPSTIFNPNTEAAISALLLALSIAYFIKLFLVSSSF